eukprot:TRINITY_DN23342_c0_g1_i1.p1 TRINITY_DN23342_c0_g1~~TRINITY_DN23342_c0_g1_i1.p1  ORF type:complete len:747 (+),score=165.08 TRINITY_DN23342_c0_g1_i1:114-2354(+)
MDVGELKPELAQFLLEEEEHLRVHVRHLFQKLDGDRNGVCDLQELRTGTPEIYARLGMEPPDDDDIMQAFRHFDANGDKKLNEEEFMEYQVFLLKKSLAKASGESCLPKVDPGDPKSPDVPFVGLLNPGSGNKMGAVFLAEAERQLVHSSRLFHIVHVYIDKGGLMTKFRAQLDVAKEEARAKMEAQPGKDFRPRLICGGGDGTASFALECVFKALMRPGSEFSGFLWSDEDMERFFPALVQLPLGTGNDLAGILGWGRTIDPATRPVLARDWFQRALSVESPTRAFDVWGLFPAGGVKACMLKGLEHGSQDRPQFKEAGPAVPFLSLLYTSMGYDALVAALVEINRTESQIMNKIQYVLHGASALFGVAHKNINLEGLCLEAPGKELFPPAFHKASDFENVGFMNINSFSAGMITASEPASFSDGQLDFFCMSVGGILAEAAQGRPGKLPTEQSSTAVWKVRSDLPCVFMQRDGEGRVLFHPKAEDWQLKVRQVMTIPVVVDPAAEGPPCSQDSQGCWKLVGSEGQIAEFSQRLSQLIQGKLVDEMNATAEEVAEIERRATEIAVLKKAKLENCKRSLRTWHEWGSVHLNKACASCSAWIEDKGCDHCKQTFCRECWRWHLGTTPNFRWMYADSGLIPGLAKLNPSRWTGCLAVDHAIGEMRAEKSGRPIRFEITVAGQVREEEKANSQEALNWLLEIKAKDEAAMEEVGEVKDLLEWDRQQREGGQEQGRRSSSFSGWLGGYPG